MCVVVFECAAPVGVYVCMYDYHPRILSFFYLLVKLFAHAQIIHHILDHITQLSHHIFNIHRVQYIYIFLSTCFTLHCRTRDVLLVLIFV